MSHAVATSAPTPTGTSTPQKPRTLVTGTAARRVLRASLFVALASIATGAMFWAFSFAPHLFVSVRAAFVCCVVLVLTMAPGAVLLALYRSIAALARLSTGECPAPEPGEEAPPALLAGHGFSRRIWEEVVPFLSLRSHLLAEEDDLAKLPGMERTVRTLVHPATAVVVPIALAVTLIQVVAAALATAAAFLRAIF